MDVPTYSCPKCGAAGCYCEHDTERAWLVERMDDKGNSRNTALGLCDGKWRWEMFSKALRFAREQDAKACACAIDLSADELWKATSHSWS